MFGLDALGLAKYGNVIAREIPDGWALGVFSNTFGDVLPALDKVLATGKVRRVRFQLLWKDDHKFTQADIPAAVKEARRITPLINKYPAVEFRVSPCCEHKMNTALSSLFIQRVKEVLPARVLMVNCPMDGGAVLPGIINECHGSKARPFAPPFDFSYDGQSCEDADVETMKKRMESAGTFYLWGCRFNGKWEDNDSTPRALRKGWPDANYVRSLVALSSPKGEAKLPRKWLYKSHAENKNGKDPRAEKPVFIIPLRAKAVEIKTLSGKSVATLPYYGTYGDGRLRYYAKSMGYLIAQQAVKLSGSPLCGVWVNGKQYGVINPAFREGEYR